MLDEIAFRVTRHEVLHCVAFLSFCWPVTGLARRGGWDGEIDSADHLTGGSYINDEPFAL